MEKDSTRNSGAIPGLVVLDSVIKPAEQAKRSKPTFWARDQESKQIKIFNVLQNKAKVK